MVKNEENSEIMAIRKIYNFKKSKEPYFWELGLFRLKTYPLKLTHFACNKKISLGTRRRK